MTLQVVNSSTLDFNEYSWNSVRSYSVASLIRGPSTFGACHKYLRRETVYKIVEVLSDRQWAQTCMQFHNNVNFRQTR
jgi:hypothetical protein